MRYYRMNNELMSLIKSTTSNFNIDPYFTYAVGTVESNNTPFTEGKPTVRFEKHVFKRELKKRDASKLPLADALSGTRIATVHKAMTIDEECALLATSWGIYQIMGFNYSVAGYRDVEDFVTAMNSVKHQIEAFCMFIKGNGLIPVMNKLDFATFARRYNGPNYAENNYDVKLKKAYNTVKK